MLFHQWAKCDIKMNQFQAAWERNSSLVSVPWMHNDVTAHLWFQSQHSNIIIVINVVTAFYYMHAKFNQQIILISTCTFRPFRQMEEGAFYIHWPETSMYRNVCVVEETFNEPVVRVTLNCQSHVKLPITKFHSEKRNKCF